MVTDVESISLPKWFVLISPAFAALVTGLIAWLANRVVGKAAFQQAINSGFKGLLDTLREEHQACQDRLEALEEKYDVAKTRGVAERAQLRGEIMNLTQVVMSLARILRQNGVPIPDGHLPASIVDSGDGLVLFQKEANHDDPST